MIPLNFNQLYYFWAIARARSISGAAKALFLTQSALSLQLKQLEKSLGVKLFVRGRFGVTLTQAGGAAFARCESMYGQAQSFRAVVRGETPGPGAVITLGAAHSVSGEQISRVLEALRRIDPRVSVRVISDDYEDLEAGLLGRAIDVVLSDMDLSLRLGEDFWGRLVGRIPIRFVAVPSLAARARGGFPAALGRLPLLLRSPENPTRRDVEHFLSRQRIDPAVAAETDDVDLIKFLLLEGRGVAAMDDVTVRRDVAEGRLKPLHAQPVGLVENIWLVAARRPGSTPTAQRVAAALMGARNIFRTTP